MGVTKKQIQELLDIAGQRDGYKAWVEGFHKHTWYHSLAIGQPDRHCYLCRTQFPSGLIATRSVDIYVFTGNFRDTVNTCYRFQDCKTRLQAWQFREAVKT